MFIGTLNKEIEETKDFLEQQCHLPGGRATPEYREAIDRLDHLRDVRREWLKP